MNENINRLLLKIAYQALHFHVDQKNIDDTLYAALEKECQDVHRGVFVSLFMNNNLRGCIGLFESNHSLHDTIIYCVGQAALHDTRFRPVQRWELTDVVIELSILSEACLIDISKIQLGKHGLIFQYESYRSVFLPKVPIEQEWTLDQTRQELALKAGLDISYSDKGDIYVFEVEVIN